MVSPGRRRIFKAREKQNQIRTRKADSFVLPKLKNGRVVGFNIIVRGSKGIITLPMKAVQRFSPKRKQEAKKVVFQ